MKNWPKNLLIYEINTWVWLNELGHGKKKPVTLAMVPEKEWDAIAALGRPADKPAELAAGGVGRHRRVPAVR